MQNTYAKIPTNHGICGLHNGWDLGFGKRPRFRITRFYCVICMKYKSVLDCCFLLLLGVLMVTHDALCGLSVRIRTTCRVSLLLTTWNVLRSVEVVQRQYAQTVAQKMFYWLQFIVRWSEVMQDMYMEVRRPTRELNHGGHSFAEIELSGGLSFLSHWYHVEHSNQAMCVKLIASGFVSCP